MLGLTHSLPFALLGQQLFGQANSIKQQRIVPGQIKPAEVSHVDVAHCSGPFGGLAGLVVPIASIVGQS